MKPIMKPLTRDQCRAVDRRAVDEYGIPSLLLMENAGRGVADVLCATMCEEPTLAARPVVILCGIGNNAGDGFVVARHLEIRSVPVRVLLLASPQELRGDARTNYEILSKTDVPIVAFSPSAGEGGDPSAWLDRHGAGAGWLVDALLGTGARGAPRTPLDAAIDWINSQPARRLAVDVPSGLDCDTGEAPGACVQADHTCTFVAAKRGFMLASASRSTGQIHVLDIGAPRKLVEEVSGGGGVTE